VASLNLVTEKERGFVGVVSLHGRHGRKIPMPAVSTKTSPIPRDAPSYRITSIEWVD